MVDRSTRTITIERVFNAPKELVWKAWTDPEMIKKWWGPETFSAPSATVDLRVGGKYLYCMRGAMGPGMPEQDFWSTGTYIEIEPMNKIVCMDSFSDKDGNIIDPGSVGMNPNFPREANVTTTFEEVGGKTKLTIRYTLDNDAAMDAMIESRMEEGWSTSLDKFGNVVEQS